MGVAAGPVTGSRFFPQLLAVLTLLGRRELLLLLNGRASREGCVRGGWLLSGSRTVRGFYGRPGGHRQRLLSIRPTIHGGTFLVAIPLIINASEDQHIQNQQDATDTHSDPQGSGRAVVMSRR